MNTFSSNKLNCFPDMQQEEELPSTFKQIHEET